MFTNILSITNLQLWEKKLELSDSSDNIQTEFEIETIDQKTCQKLAIQNQWEANFTTAISGILEFSDICFVAKKAGSLVHWTHVTFKSVYIAEIGKKIVLDSGSAYLFGIFTNKHNRKSGIASAVIQKVTAYLAGKGTKKVYIIIDSHNNSITKIITKAGFTQIGAVKFVKMGKLKIYSYKGAIKDFLV